MLQKGGLAWFGGLIFGVLFAVIYMRSKRLPVYKTLDLLVPFVALAQAIGRIGCLFNGCCYGKYSQFGIYFPAHDVTLIPTQLYSSFLLVAIYIVLRVFQALPHKSGQIFYAYLLLYTAKRFLIEFLRGDSPVLPVGLTLFQLICIAIFIISIFGLIRVSRK
jgi:phosphatidylglycerol:prolipoprotein diacylglycerol transferase